MFQMISDIKPIVIICETLENCLCIITNIMHMINNETFILQTQVQLHTQRMMALTFALIKQMLQFENRPKDACDLGSNLWIASLAVTCARNTNASLPQAPYESTARGIETHPRAMHLSSLAWCFLLSVASRTAPTIAPASAKVEGFSGETTVMSKATGLPRSQFCTSISAGRDCEWLKKSPAPASIWTEACAW